VRGYQHIARYAPWVLALGLLSPFWTVSGQALQFQRPDHLTPEQTVEFEAGKKAASGSSEYEDTSTTATERELKLKTVLSALGNEPLLAFTTELARTLNLNPESLNALVEALPPLDASKEKDAQARAALSAELEQALSDFGSEAKTKIELIAKNVLKEKLSATNGVASSQSVDEAIIAKAKEVEAKEAEKLDALKKELETALASQKDALEKAKKAESERGALPLDPSLFASGNGNESGAGGAGAGDPGAGASGSPSSGNSSGRSDKADPSRSEKDKDSNGDKRFADLFKSLESSKSEPAAKDSENTSSASSEIPRKRKRVEPESVPEENEASQNPYSGSEEGASAAPSFAGSGSQRPTLSGKTSSLSPIPDFGASNVSALSGAGGTGASGGGGSVSPVQGSVGGGAASTPSGAQGFPFGGPGGAAASSGGPAQKYEYARANPYLSSNGEAGIADGFGDESLPEEARARVAATEELLMGNLRRASREPLASSASEPAFARALSAALGTLCAKGTLECDRSRMKTGGR
jgi:hypothetical protein